MRNDDIFRRYRIAFSNPATMRRLIHEAMALRYAIGLGAMFVAQRFHESLPLPYPHFFLGSILFVAANAILHLLSAREALLPVTFILLPYFDIGFAPLILATSGGVMSPFLITHFITLIGSGLLYTSNRNLAFHSFIILLVSYLGVALFQKAGILPGYLPFTMEVMENDVFFYLVMSITVLIITFGYLLVTLLNSHVHRTLDDLTRSFDRIVKGTTAVVNEDFFSNLVRCCAETFDIRCVFLAEVRPRERRLCTLAIWHKGRLEENYTLPLRGALACEFLEQPEIRVMEPSRFGHYAGDPLTSLFHATYVFGLPLKAADGKRIGVLMALNDSPVDSPHLLEPLFTIFATRAAAELERKSADERKAHLEHLLAQSHKMEAIGHLAGGIVHDFNNVINAISGYVSLMRKRLGPEHPQNRYLEHISGAARNAMNITERLSLFVKNEKPRIGPVDVHVAIGAAVSMLNHMKHQSDFTVELDLKAPAPYTPGDMSLLQNVFLNLGINARDACERKPGLIVFGTSLSTLDCENVLCQSFSIDPGPYLRITARDNGCGIGEETMAHLFEPFFTTKERGKGTGQGLANVWHYIENYRGTIEVRSRPGEGAEFTLYLPVCTGE